MRIGLISDLHILDLSGVKFYEFFNKRIIGGLNLLLNRSQEYKIEFVEKLINDVNKQNLDILVITGDITNLASDSEFKRAKELIEKFDIKDENIIIIPGNHDNYIKSSYQKKLFEKYMSKWIKSTKEKSEVWPIIKKQDDILIFGFSSSIPSCPLCSAGKISKEQLIKFKEVTDKNKDCFKIAMLHHHLPKLSKLKQFSEGLRNREEVLSYLSEADIDMVLHGHKHRNSHYKVNFNNKVINVYEAGASARLSQRHAGNWSIYEIKDKKLANIEKRFLDFETQEFIIKN